MLPAAVTLHRQQACRGRSLWTQAVVFLASSGCCDSRWPLTSHHCHQNQPSPETLHSSLFSPLLHPPGALAAAVGSVISPITSPGSFWGWFLSSRDSQQPQLLLPAFPISPAKLAGLQSSSSLALWLLGSAELKCLLTRTFLC